MCLVNLDTNIILVFVKFLLFNMNIVYVGTSEFAVASLNALYHAGHKIVLVLTQPDKRSGRGLKIQSSPVKRYALARGMSILQPVSLRLDGKFANIAHMIHENLRTIPHDIIIVSAYGLMLPSSILQIPYYGCVNIHASLLPRWRGAAPIHRAIEAGDKKTGITIIQMKDSLDTGPILMSKEIPIFTADNTGTLHARLAKLGAEMIVQVLQQLEQGNATLTPQLECNASYAVKIHKNEMWLDFTQSAEVLSRRIRAFNPFPGASVKCGELIIKLWQAQALFNKNYVNYKPGRFLCVNSMTNIFVVCGEGILKITELQKSGGQRLQATEFLRGLSIKYNKLFNAICLDIIT